MISDFHLQNTDREKLTNRHRPKQTVTQRVRVKKVGGGGDNNTFKKFKY